MGELTPDKIATEIEKTGYPLELRAAEVLRRPNSHLAYNVYYIDSDEQKGREIDLRWLRNVRIGPLEGPASVWVRYSLAIECKRATKPWVFLTSPRASYDQEIGSALYYGLPRLALSQDELKRARERHPMFRSHSLGRGFFEAFKSEEKESRIFGAVVTAVKATLAARQEEFAATSGNSICFYYPLVIVDGPMFEGRLENGSVVAQEVSRTVVSFSYASPAYGDQQLLVPVIRIEEMAAFVDELDEVHEYVADCLLAAVERGEYKPKNRAT